MLTKVSITISGGGLDAPYVAGAVPPGPPPRLKEFCNLCNREGFLSPLYGSTFKRCPLCKGKKYVYRVNMIQSRLARVLTPLREAGLLKPYLLLPFTLSVALGLTCNAVFEGFKAALAYLF